MNEALPVTSKDIRKYRREGERERERERERKRQRDREREREVKKHGHFNVPQNFAI